MLKANAGFIRFKPPVTDADGNPQVVFQVGIRTAQTPQSISLGASGAPAFFTAFECSDAFDGAIIYDTVVYISNRSDIEVTVEYKITNAEHGNVVANSFVTVGPWKMLGFSLAGHLK